MLGPEATLREVGSYPRCCGKVAKHGEIHLLEPSQSQEPPCCSSEAVNGELKGAPKPWEGGKGDKSKTGRETQCVWEAWGCVWVSKQVF